MKSVSKYRRIIRWKFARRYSSVRFTTEQVACARLRTAHLLLLLLHGVLLHSWSLSLHLLAVRSALTHLRVSLHARITAHHLLLTSTGSSRIVLSLALHALELVLAHGEARVAVRTTRAAGARLTRSLLLLLPLHGHMLSTNVLLELGVTNSVGGDPEGSKKDLVSE